MEENQYCIGRYLYTISAEIGTSEHITQCEEYFKQLNAFELDHKKYHLGKRKLDIIENIHRYRVYNLLLESKTILKNKNKMNTTLQPTTETSKTPFTVKAVTRDDAFPNIKYDEPIPTDHKRVGCRNWKKIFQEWKVGGYVDVPSQIEAGKYRSSAYANDVKLIGRKQAGGVIRLWRTE